MDTSFHQRPRDEQMVLPSSSSSGRLTRKRAGSINIEQANRQKFENLSLSTPSSAGLTTNSDGRDYICLCAPAPKVPRPRNAFILYRQHHQAAVTAENPGLPNPEVSKIIGEQWRKEAEVVKAYWKNLAEEEKQRHQLQYPDYRYTPRRGARGSGRSSISSEDGGRCPKCGGRYIATPRTPSVHYQAGRTSGATPYGHPNLNHGEEAYFVPPGHGGLGPNRVPQPYGFSPSGGLRNIQEEEYDSMFAAPESKRRRFDTPPGYPTERPPGNHPSQNGPHSGRPDLMGRAFSDRLYGAGTQLAAGNEGLATSASAPSTSQQDPVALPPLRSNLRFDESLRLPPLHTQLAPTQEAVETPVLAVAKGKDSQEKGVVAMIMSIPYLKKIEVLCNITPSYPQLSSRNSDKVASRGYFIAVDGPVDSTLHEVGAAVERALQTYGDAAVKTFVNPAPIPAISGLEFGFHNSQAGTSANEDPSRHLDAYIRLISQWHELSKDIIDHITTTPEPTSEMDVEMRRSASDGNIALSSSTQAENRGYGIPNHDRFDNGGSKYIRKPGTGCSSKIPIALVPGGFSVTLSDRFACAAPITDTYSPVDHWQWMATLWRGIVSPDLFIYVKPSSENDVNQRNTVEVKSHNVMLVRVPKGTSLDQKTERRLAFEITEWVRAGQGHRV